MSIYRVSTATSYDGTISRINQRTAELTAMQEKLAAGKRVLRASDDPVAATLAERESNRLMRTEADMRALERSRSGLQLAESSIGQMGEVLARFKELLVQGGNASLSASDRQSLAQEMRGLREQLLNLANTQDSEGNALLGGLGVTNVLGKPFADVYGANTGVVFQAISGQAAPTETGLPNRVDGDFALMRNLSGDGVLTINLKSGNALVSDTRYPGPLSAEVFPFNSTDASHGRYELTVASLGGAPETLELQISRVGRTNELLPPPATVTQLTTIPLGAVGADGTIALTSRSVSFDGIQLTLSGLVSSGDQIEINPSEPTNLFASLQMAIDALENSDLNSAGRTQALSRVHQEMQTGQDRLLLVRGRLGELLRRADSIEGLLQDRSVAGQKELSNLTDLDLVKGISDFQTQQLGLQAALQSYAQVQRLSLFQYIA